MAARVLTEEDLEPLRRELADLRAQLEGRAVGSHLTTEQAASLAGVTPKTVRTWLATGALPASRRGRRLMVRRSDLETYLAGDRPRAGTLLASLTPISD